MRNYYDVLQVTPIASDNEIKSAYNRLKKEYSLQEEELSVKENGSEEEESSAKENSSKEEESSAKENSSEEEESSAKENSSEEEESSAKEKTNLEEVEEAYKCLSNTFFRKQYDKQKFPTPEIFTEICSVENMAKNFSGNNFINNSLFGFKGKIGSRKFAQKMMIIWIMIIWILGHIYLPMFAYSINDITFCCINALFMLLIYVLQGGLFARRLRFLGKPFLPFLVPYGLIAFGTIAYMIKIYSQYVAVGYPLTNIVFYAYGGFLDGWPFLAIAVLYAYLVFHNRVTEVYGKYVSDNGFSFSYLIWLAFYLFEWWIVVNMNAMNLEL